MSSEVTEVVLAEKNAEQGLSKSAAQHSLDATIDFIGGVNGGIATVYVGQPLDTVKVKMQTFPHLYKNAVQCFSQTFKQDGIRGLYAGTVPALAANIAENSVLFMAYGICQKFVISLTGKTAISEMSALENASAGFCAAFFSSLTLCPTELVKCRLQALRETCTMKGQDPKVVLKNVGPWSVTRDVLKAEGIRGIYVGFTATLMREMPGYFFFFGGYEVARGILTPQGKTKNEIGPIRTALAGGFGGVCLWGAIFPADVVKSRVQISSTAGQAGNGFTTVFLKIYREEGIRALYRGLGPGLLRTFPATGALFVAFEWTKTTLHKLTSGEA